jgi:hypothetical protein
VAGALAAPKVRLDWTEPTQISLGRDSAPLAYVGHTDSDGGHVRRHDRRACRGCSDVEVSHRGSRHENQGRGQPRPTMANRSSAAIAHPGPLISSALWTEVIDV